LPGKGGCPPSFSEETTCGGRVALRIPQLIQRFLPFSVLLGTLITLAGLNQHSEVVSMKAAGISAHQIIAPLILASMGIAALSFAFNERVVTRASATLARWTAVDYGAVLNSLAELDTKDVPPTSHVVAMETPFREDEVTNGPDPDAAVVSDDRGRQPCPPGRRAGRDWRLHG